MIYMINMIGEISMKFILYNIRYGTGKYLNQPFKHVRGYLSKSEEHIIKIGEFLSSYDADIVGLVEVDLGSYRANNKNQAEILGKILNSNHIYRHKYEDDSSMMKVPILKRQGNAFLSKLDSDEKFRYFQKGMKKLIIELETDEFVIFLVHLALGGKTRLHQIVELYDLMDQCDKPFIVAGDFNLFWGEEEISLFLKALNLKNANINNKPTYPSWNPKKTLDFILYSDKIKIKSFDVLKCNLSDHLPLFIDFEIENGTE